MKRGQLKIQEMAFVLVAIFIFFGLVALIFSNVLIKDLRKDAVQIREEQAQALVKKLISVPEFSWTKDCETCIDHDKVIALKERKSYKNFWNLDYMAVEQIYPAKLGGECTKGNYPECNITTIIGGGEKTGKSSVAFVALCRWERESNYNKCSLGRIITSGEGIR